MPMVVSPVNPVGVVSMVPSQSLSFAPSRVTDEMDGSSPVETGSPVIVPIIDTFEYCEALSFPGCSMCAPFRSVGKCLVISMRLDCFIA